MRFWNLGRVWDLGEHVNSMKPLQGAIYTLPHPPRVCNVTPVRLIKAPWTLYAILSILFQTLLLNLFSLVPHLTLPGLGGGASGPAASNILMWFFIDLSNWSKISWLFLKFTWENFVNFFFSYFSQLLLTLSFFNKGNSCEKENSIYFDAMVKINNI